MDFSRLNDNGGADEVTVALAAKAFGAPLPGDYAAFLTIHNGGAGFVGKTFIVLWKAEDLAEHNDNFGVAKSAAGLILFGTDGGVEAFGCDTRKDPAAVVMVPFSDLTLAAAKPLADSFDAFIKRLETDETVVPPN